MQRRPSAAVPPLAPPMHPAPLPRRRSSLLSQGSSPHTPPNSNTPLPLLASAANRKSSDSWNSSNYDGGDDQEMEWSSEQTRLLSRTLDALPSHLFTPFIGAVPPSNLLDKIARGVSQAKGPLDWPHSMRATRAKIVELCRIRAKEVASDGASDTIAEEDGSDPGVQQQTSNIGPKRPLYRQSSMDFMQTDKRSLTENSNISRLSRRLQRTDRLMSNPSHHPHANPSTRSPSPGFAISGLPTFLPSTPSSTTLNSTNSGYNITHVRRSMSDMSNSSDSFILPAMDPRVQRVKRGESFGGAMLFGPGQSLKRAPSFGAASKRSSGAMSLSGRDSDVTSSDEEEKLRSVKAKKARVKATSPTPSPSSPIASPNKSKLHRKSTQQLSSKSSRSTKDSPSRQAPRPKVNLQRNPSILGGELPHPQPNLEFPATRLSHPNVRKTNRSPKITDSPATDSSAKRNINSRPIDSLSTPSTPQDSQSKSLRRSKGSRLPQRGVARKISFGSPAASEPNGDLNSGSGLGLGSAFQLL